MKSLFEEMGGTYTLGADGMYYPDLELPEEEPHYGKYGRMRLRYLKEHHKMLYNTLLLDGELVKHLNEVDDTANQRMELLTLQMQEQQGINEALKARDQMAWVGACNNIRNAAEDWRGDCEAAGGNARRYPFAKPDGVFAKGRYQDYPCLLLAGDSGILSFVGA